MAGLVASFHEKVLLQQKLITDLYSTLCILNSQPELRSPRVTALLKEAQPWIKEIEVEEQAKIQLAAAGAVH